MADNLSDESKPTQPEPVVEPMPAASSEPVSTVTPLVAAIQAAERRSYKGRFALVYAGLGLLLATAAAVFVWVIVGGTTPGGTGWSAWKPSEGSRLDMAGEIARHVAPQYRLAPGGAQLVAVKATPPEVQDISVEEVALKGGSANDDYEFVSTNDAVVYVLCGLGPRCSIASGTPSIERARLLRREALELALYTFKYVDGVDSVIALIPPPANDPDTNWALFFRKRDFEEELSKPLSQTLPPPPPGKRLVPDVVKDTPDGTRVEKLTRPYWFTSQFQQLQDGNAVLVLDPVIAPR